MKTSLPHIYGYARISSADQNMWDYLSNEDTRAIAFSYGLDVYVHTVNDISAAQEFLDAGVRGIYTGRITAKDVHSDRKGLIEEVTQGSH